MTRRATQEETIAAFKKRHGDTYDYSGVEYTTNHKRVTIRCLEHGTFQQSPAAHKRGSGCPVCGANRTGKANRLTWDRFVEKATVIHKGKYKYKRSSFAYSTAPTKIFCREHGWFEQTADCHMNGRGCHKCADIAASNTNSRSGAEWVQVFIQRHGDKYAYPVLGNDVRSETKVMITCNTCMAEFKQTASAHASGQGCPTCKNEKIARLKRADVEDVRERLAKAVGDGYSFDLSDYTNMHTPIRGRCPVHGKFEATVNALLHGATCSGCKKVQVSEGERRLARYVQTLTSNVLLNDRDIIRPHELDIVCPDQCVAIEYNGNFWHSSRGGKAKQAHINKMRKTQAAGYRVIFIRDDEWREKQAIVESIIRNALGKTVNKVAARKCEKVLLTKHEWYAFADDNHIQGRRGATVVHGLTYEDELVCCAAFVENRATGNELVRFVTKLDTNVRGGFSRLIKAYGKPFHTYCENRLFAGGGYTSSGLVKSEGQGKAQPDLWYTNGHDVLNRRMFQKKAQAARWDDFDWDKTEVENAAAHGWFQLWGCGTTRYEYRG